MGYVFQIVGLIKSSTLQLRLALGGLFLEAGFLALTLEPPRFVYLAQAEVQKAEQALGDQAAAVRAAAEAKLRPYLEAKQE